MPDIEIAGRRVHFETGRIAEPVDGEGIILIHGAGGNSLIWLSQRRALGEEAFACALDLPGHGGSQGPASDTIGEYAAFVGRFASALGLERATLVGHSMGGAIAMETALSRPELVRSLVLTDTGAKLRVAEIILKGLVTDFDRTIGMMREFAFSPNAAAEVVDPVIAEMKKCDPGCVLADFTACDRFDRREDLSGIHVPTLVICGEDDQLTPVKYSEYLHDGIPGSRLRVIPGAGHMVMVERPEELNSALAEFLSGGG